MNTLAAADPSDGGMNSWLSDASNDILQRVAAGAVEANQWMMLKAIDLINSGLRVNLGADWLQEILTTMRPRLHLFGHHHEFTDSARQGVRSIGLDMVTKSYLLINDETLRCERLDT